MTSKNFKIVTIKNPIYPLFIAFVGRIFKESCGDFGVAKSCESSIVSPKIGRFFKFLAPSVPKNGINQSYCGDTLAYIAISLYYYNKKTKIGT